MSDTNPRSVLHKEHHEKENYRQRMPAKEWKAILLANEDHIIFRGIARKLKADNIGYGVVEVYKPIIYKQPEIHAS